MNEYDLLVSALRQFKNTVWLDQYFNLLKKLLSELNMEDADPRLVLSLRTNKTMPVNIGQRYVLKPLRGEKIGCITTAGFEHEAVNATINCYFSSKGTRDAKWIIAPYLTGSELPAILFNAIIEASADILNKTNKSGFRRYHSSLLYHFTMERAVRDEVLEDVETGAR